jgi:poly-gamma-glutamate synthesis protein (capsule biosynthesis protein)
MFVVIVKRPKNLSFLVLVLLVLLVSGSAFYLWSWLNAPYPPPTIGIEGLSTQLVGQLFFSEQIGGIQLAAAPELLLRLNTGELDYVLEVDAPTPGLVSWSIGQLQPVIVVPFFDRVTKMSLTDLETLIQTESEHVLVSSSLALPGFPWSNWPVHYLSSAEVVSQLQDGMGKIGILPFQDRQPSARIVPVSGSSLPSRSLYLSRSPKGLPERVKDRYTDHQDLKSTYTERQGHQMTMLAVGDIMLDRDVKKVGLQKGWEHIFSEVAPRLRQADLAFANLESPIGDKGHFINMFQAPPEAMTGVASAGFDVVSLANNHALDYHHAGMFETMRLLEEHQIAWVGAGRNIHEARAPLIKEVKGVKIGFLAYTEMWFVHAREPISWEGTEDEPGVAPAQLDIIVEDIGKLRGDVDCVIVTMHWGKEYIHEPTSEQRRLARAAIDAGADLVLGHHPHVLQGIEFYRQGVIAYSLGNFVFDINLPATWETMILEFTLSPAGPLDMNIIPAYIFGVQPQILKGSHSANLYDRIRDFSLKID